MVRGDRRGVALHRAGQADAERLLRELQRPDARRAAERDAVVAGVQLEHQSPAHRLLENLDCGLLPVEPFRVAPSCLNKRFALIGMVE